MDENDERYESLLSIILGLIAYIVNIKTSDKENQNNNNLKEGDNNNGKETTDTKQR